MSYPIVRRYSDYGVSIGIESHTRRVLYSYDASGVQFVFDLLSHVGEPFQNAFKQLIADNSLTIETYDNPADKYAYGYYERIG